MLLKFREVSASLDNERMTAIIRYCSCWKLTLSTNFRPHRLHTIHEMRPTATDVGRSVVCVSVCVGHTGELCKHGWTDQDAVWGLTHCGSKKTMCQMEVKTGILEDWNPFATGRCDKALCQTSLDILKFISHRLLGEFCWHAQKLFKRSNR